MKLIYSLFISLIALSNCITQVFKNSRTKLTENSFYLTGSSYYSGSNLFLFFEDRSYYLDYDNLQICFTDKDPFGSDPCSSWDTIKSSHRSRINSDTDLKYYFNYKYSDGRYIIVKFDRINGHSGGNLYVRSYNEETHENTYETDRDTKTTSSFGGLSIVFIVFGSITVVIIVILIIIWCRRIITGRPIGYVEPAYVVTAPDPVICIDPGI